MLFSKEPLTKAPSYIVLVDVRVELGTVVVPVPVVIFCFGAAFGLRGITALSREPCTMAAS
jgi:hypothetical protein